MHGLWSKLFRKRKEETSAVPTLEKLMETLSLLEKKEAQIQKHIDKEVEKAQQYIKQKKKNAAIQCLKKKKMYEAQAANISSYQLRLHDQMIMLENASATTDVVGALREGAGAMKKIQKQTKLDDVDRTMDEINEQSEAMRQIQVSISTPAGDLDEEDLEKELEDLEDAESGSEQQQKLGSRVQSPSVTELASSNAPPPYLSQSPPPASAAPVHLATHAPASTGSPVRSAPNSTLVYAPVSATPAFAAPVCSTINGPENTLSTAALHSASDASSAKGKEEEELKQLIADMS